MSTIQTLLKPSDTIGLIACSDGVKPEYRSKVTELITILQSFGLRVDVAGTLYRRESFFSGTPVERASEFIRLFAAEDVKAVMDISGGDSANQILPFINFDLVRQNPKPFFGMSDLSVILNAIHHQCNFPTYHYQGMNLVDTDGERQRAMFYRSFFEGRNDLFAVDYEWIRGKTMRGVVIGGNIRCFLKLAGTPYLPDFDGKIVFLESFGGRANRILSLLAQLSQAGAFAQCSGIILGSFSEAEEYRELPVVIESLQELSADFRLPIVRTKNLGHGVHCQCIKIGDLLKLER